ncbi:metal ABC transporter ATP-binding protein [Bacillus sp. FJAT-45350]|uniref:metal ABC transporter ATP-binding protein n=1 Tax=Bacillus sp. FJAT-45350 TaxID=2011014 RepID=UPI000BB747EC|nr:metal ABC transporter ATP-binding protein [Bacillus sp. FJAT-45350]
MTNHSVEINNLAVYYYDEKALDISSLSLPNQELIGIIGPNGAGKSTFIKSVMGIIPTKSGEMKIFSNSIKKSRKRISYVPQRSNIDMDFPVLVEDVVVMGRYPHLSWWRRPGNNDREIARNCLEKVGMLDFSKRQIGELSGGQQQRVFLARALAQESDLFFLDEPFAGIDMTSEKIIINILKDLKKQGKTLLVVHHDLNKVKDYFDSLIIINKELIDYGKTDEVFHMKNLEKAYKGKVTFVSNDGETMVVGG